MGTALSAFQSEWILSYLLQYTTLVSTHHVDMTHVYLLNVWETNTCGSEVYKHLFRATVTAEEIPTRELGVVSCTTRYIGYLIVSQCAPFTYAVCLTVSNSKNSNVQHGFSGERENYQSLDNDYWIRYNSTETTSCHMIFAPLMDMDININVSKCQSCGHSIHGETKDLVANISSAQKPERTRLVEECSYNFNLCLSLHLSLFLQVQGVITPLHLRSEGSPDPVPNWIRFYCE